MTSALAWTEDDQRQCIGLLYKARDCGVLPALMKHIREPECGWDVIPDKPDVGAMSDASKRLRENDGPTSYGGRGSEHPVPMPSATTTESTMPNLPPGVKSISEWGRNMVSFGKFMNKRSYLSLHQSHSDEDVSYKKWLMCHYAKGSHQLRDLVEYLMAVQDEVAVDAGKSQQILIPGTNIPRRLSA
eukprot:s2072_g23.t1